MENLTWDSLQQVSNNVQQVNLNIVRRFLNRFMKNVMLSVKLAVQSLTWDKWKGGLQQIPTSFQQCPTNQYEYYWIGFKKFC